MPASLWSSIPFILFIDSGSNIYRNYAACAWGRKWEKLSYGTESVLSKSAEAYEGLNIEGTERTLKLSSP